MRTLWKKGRNMYASFFAELGEVRQEIGDEALPHWCMTELHIGISVCHDCAKLLRGADEKRARDDLKRAKAAEKERHHDNKTDNATIELGQLRARIAELEEQLAARDNETKLNQSDNETKRNKGGRPCNGERPMTGYERLKAYRARQRSH